MTTQFCGVTLESRKETSKTQMPFARKVEFQAPRPLHNLPVSHFGYVCYFLLIRFRLYTSGRNPTEETVSSLIEKEVHMLRGGGGQNESCGIAWDELVQGDGYRNKHIPTAVCPQLRDLGSYGPFPIEKSQGYLESWLMPGLGQGEYKMSLELLCQKIRACLKIRGPWLAKSRTM